MPRRFCLILLGLCTLASPALLAEAPALLAKALQRWTAGQGDMAFTQQTTAR
jgi:hypothetical protein